ncbi:SDR family oxidoreductase [Caulobacter sp. SLTY]|uniref:SDR family NAD(P)-dependent oxidoreductase n=1 Tax=Caulobacter sp. SLTY TaxID=2683262 RepID=UPI00141200E5|nr:SDR family NAD(P)-dependent oxidoreductase [Caulobacter sp. SLTY]NBB14927.1 SDR family oxidoreductase [Caulobacter sp. SLTY]
MADDERYIRPPSAESEGRAPGRGRMAGRRVLVVGGGQRTVDAETDPVGNGRAMSLLLAREGAAVAVADRNEASAAQTVALIAAEGGNSVPIGADIRHEADVAAMVETAVREMGGLDGMVCNVGVGLGGLGLSAVKTEEWDQVLGINLRGPMLCCREALPAMESGGSVVFISSIAGLVAGSRLPAYDASKAALGGLMRHVALEGARKGVRANIVAPGLVDTPLGRAATQGRPSRGRAPVPFGRQATGWEVAYAALFFLSDESVYVTGQTLAVDSGMTGIS